MATDRATEAAEARVEDSSDQPTATDVAGNGPGFPGYGKAYDLIGTGVTREQMNTEVRFRPEWDEHTARDWPSDGVERPGQVERSADPEGSWRDKDSGRFLSPEQNADVNGRYELMKGLADHYGEQVTASAADAQGETAGYEFRLKGDDRLKDKVAAELEARPGRSAEEVLAKIPDAIRYTITIPDNNYVDGVDNAVSSMRSYGFQLVNGGWRNSWDNDIYRGINSRWRDPENGQLLELQFHTPGSFYAKQVTHEAYERARQPGLCGEELQEIDRIQGDVTRAVRVPEGATGIYYEPDWRRTNE